MSNYEDDYEVTEVESFDDRKARRRSQDSERPRREDVRQPQDHKKGGPQPLGLEPREILYDGFTYTVKPAVLDDWQKVLANQRGEETDPVQEFVELLGQDGYEDLMENTKEKYGYVSIEVMTGIFEATRKQCKVAGK